MAGTVFLNGIHYNGPLAKALGLFYFNNELAWSRS